MLSIISPAKTQDFTSQIVGLPSVYSNQKSMQPHFFTKTQVLLQICKNLSQNQIKQLMGVSDKLAELNYHRFQDFDSQPQKQAIFAYDGDVYNNIDRQNFTAEQWDFLQGHTLIISGLYGALRVFEKIKPYRLEMSTKLPNFWQNDITNYINQILATQQNKYLINLASNEYSCVINQNDLKYPIINIYFKERRNNKLQIIAINSKKARGSMFNFIAENLIDLPEKLKHFSKQNYQYSETESSNNDWIFVKNA
ncbi:YaaA family protein [Rickettsia endosymbiont of Oedothorax gibbosus]|uniref:YaaA family protein n=1 Tax=Rickettsia endosymbiont of Oedothorax gibbosus TaxID=931099 RepID=UPI002024F2A7|nr:peroxide stress protein YaaA [Rickettsia endosymbiont of Oedothorax gibbosus]